MIRPPDSPWTPERLAALQSAHPGATLYFCTVNGAGAVGFENANGHFVVAGGSVAAAVHPALDTFSMQYRELFAPDGTDPKSSFDFPDDIPYLRADVAARVVCGCPSDEAAWIAADGSHPIVRKQSE